MPNRAISARKAGRIHHEGDFMYDRLTVRIYHLRVRFNAAESVPYPRGPSKAQSVESKPDEQVSLCICSRASLEYMCI